MILNALKPYTVGIHRNEDDRDRTPQTNHYTAN